MLPDRSIAHRDLQHLHCSRYLNPLRRDMQCPRQASSWARAPLPPPPAHPLVEGLLVVLVEALAPRGRHARARGQPAPGRRRRLRRRLQPPVARRLVLQRLQQPRARKHLGAPPALRRRALEGRKLRVTMRQVGFVQQGKVPSPHNEKRCAALLRRRWCAAGCAGNGTRQRATNVMQVRAVQQQQQAAASNGWYPYRATACSTPSGAAQPACPQRPGHCQCSLAPTILAHAASAAAPPSTTTIRLGFSAGPAPPPPAFPSPASTTPFLFPSFPLRCFSFRFFSSFPFPSFPFLLPLPLAPSPLPLVPGLPSSPLLSSLLPLLLSLDPSACCCCAAGTGRGGRPSRARARAASSASCARMRAILPARPPHLQPPPGQRMPRESRAIVKSTILSFPSHPLAVTRTHASRTLSFAMLWTRSAVVTRVGPRALPTHCPGGVQRQGQGLSLGACSTSPLAPGANHPFAYPAPRPRAPSAPPPTAHLPQGSLASSAAIFSSSALAEANVPSRFTTAAALPLRAAGDALARLPPRPRSDPLSLSLLSLSLLLRELRPRLLPLCSLPLLLLPLLVSCSAQRGERTCSGQTRNPVCSSCTRAQVPYGVHDVAPCSRG